MIIASMHESPLLSLCLHHDLKICLNVVLNRSGRWHSRRQCGYRLPPGRARSCKGIRLGMDGSFSRVIFLYGMALVLAVGKACTLLIWRTLSKPRPSLRQEVIEAWRRRKAGPQATKEATRKPQTPSPNVKEGLSDAVLPSNASVTEYVNDRSSH